MRLSSASLLVATSTGNGKFTHALAMHTECHIADFRVLYADDDLVAVHKPAGLLVHRSALDRRETRFALQMTRDALGQRVFPLHRLDKATSGVLLFARHAEAARIVAARLARREVRKTYLAVVRGWPDAAGVIDSPLHYERDEYAEPERDVQSEPQSARTRFECLATTTLDQALGRYAQQRYALVALHPETGRKHQLRRHLRRINHPIIGDVNHGDRHHNHLFFAWRGYHRLYLAATALQLAHPRTGETLCIAAPPQADFAQTCAALDLQLPRISARFTRAASPCAD